jgi:hypothetical protein
MGILIHMNTKSSVHEQKYYDPIEVPVILTQNSTQGRCKWLIRLKPFGKIMKSRVILFRKRNAPTT